MRHYLERYYKLHQYFGYVESCGIGVASQLIELVEQDIASLESGMWEYVPEECISKRVEWLFSVYYKLESYCQ